MSNSISGIGGNNMGAMMQGMRGMKRPDPSEMADKLFSKLDTAGQGYIEKADLQAALSKVSSSDSSSAIDDMFSKLDTDSDGKVTKSEFSDTLTKLTEQLENQAMSFRMNGGMQGGMGGMQGMGGMPPPPPPNGDGGFTKDELTSQLEETDSSDSTRSSLSSIVENFEAADSDGDGKVSFREAMAYEQQSASGATTTEASASASTEETNAKVMMQIMKLMQAYDIGGEDTNPLSTLSVTA